MLKTVLKIDGMMCGMCESHVNDVIRKMIPEAKKVTSSHAKGESSFLTEKEPDITGLKEAIDKTGYTSGCADPWSKRRSFHRLHPDRS